MYISPIGKKEGLNLKAFSLKICAQKAECNPPNKASGVKRRKVKNAKDSVVLTKDRTWFVDIEDVSILYLDILVD